MSEPPENWLTVAGWVGGVGGVALAAFAASYTRARGDARNSIERAPEIAANAVGAAFVDRSAAQAIIQIARDVSAILDLMMKKAGEDHDDRIAMQAAELAEKRLLDKLGQKREP